jgi:hypothetical protein
VKQSIADKTYAKLTLAKTIGDTEIKNIYVRVLLEMMYLCFRLAKIQNRRVESFHTIDEAYIILASYLNNPF